MKGIDDSNFNITTNYRPLDRPLAGEKVAQHCDDIMRLPVDLVQATMHTAVQTPINSLAQMVGPDTMRHFPQLHIIDAPEAAPEFSPRWQAQQLGAALGAGADLLALDLAWRGLVPAPVLGACYDGLMRPVDKADEKDQWGARVHNAAVGAVTFGVMNACNSAIGAYAAKREAAAWKTLGENSMLRSTLAGIPAGLAATAMSGGRTVHDFAIGAYTSAISGLGIGAIHAGLERQAVGKDQAREIGALKHELRTDYLTGSGNRRGSDEILHSEFARAERTGKPVSMIYGDLDGFKAVNDKIGHEAGDFVLKETARLLSENVRIYDHVARTGGDEFTIVLPETDQATAQVLAKRLENTVRLKVGDASHSQNVGISLGVVTRQPEDINVDAFKKRADSEMYRTKQIRKGSI